MQAAGRASRHRRLYPRPCRWDVKLGVVIHAVLDVKLLDPGEWHVVRTTRLRAFARFKAPGQTHTDAESNALELLQVRIAGFRRRPAQRAELLTSPNALLAGP